MARESKVLALYRRLLAEYGPQHWWPAETDFEMTVGAILTQNTAWRNVEKAVANLREAGLLDPQRMSRAGARKLAGLIRPAGYFNQKSRRLAAWARFFAAEWPRLRRSRRPTESLRRELLALDGIGPETADSILCYGLGRPAFVVDAYTRRLLSRLGWMRGDEPYEALRSRFESSLPQDARLLGEAHALIVEHAKERCRKAPLCGGCPLVGLCRQARTRRRKQRCRRSK